MRPRAILTAFVAMTLVLGMASFAFAADQQVDVSVYEPGILTIEVEPAFGLGPVVPGRATGQRGFWNRVTNTTDTGWQVFADSTDLVTVEWREPCGDHGCTPILLDPFSVIAKGNLRVYGGDLNHWEDIDVIQAYTVQPGFDVGLLIQATSEAFGVFELNDPHPAVELLTPADADFGDYVGAITYTIQAFTGGTGD